jgi:hypothetical protein
LAAGTAQITRKSHNNTTVTITEITIEPAHPIRLEKKKNTGLPPQGPAR